jgi:hypothetical protein
MFGSQRRSGDWRESPANSRVRSPNPIPESLKYFDPLLSREDNIEEISDESQWIDDLGTLLKDDNHEDQNVFVAKMLFPRTYKDFAVGDLSACKEGLDTLSLNDITISVSPSQVSR